jgi:ribosomal protein S10
MTASIAQQKIRIRLKAFDRRMLDLSCDKIIQTADTTSASAIGPIPLPTKRKFYCVLRSPHVDKDSREHFEIKIKPCKHVNVFFGSACCRSVYLNESSFSHTDRDDGSNSSSHTWLRAYVLELTLTLFRHLVGHGGYMHTSKV